MKILKFLAAALLAIFASGSLAGCAAQSEDPTSYAAIIDVRTEEEWATGHLEGAVRIGLADADFASQLENLDKAADYYIYCRSGNRAGQAIDFMKSNGFTGKLTNGGSVANAASATGLNIVVE